jgi:hypothetical protein
MTEKQHCHRLLLLVVFSERELDAEADSCYSRKGGDPVPSMRGAWIGLSAAEVKALGPHRRVSIRHGHRPRLS